MDCYGAHAPCNDGTPGGSDSKPRVFTPLNDRNTGWLNQADINRKNKIQI